jgi:hypothetical protein
MASLVSHLLFETKPGRGEGSLAIGEDDQLYSYYSESNTPRNEVYEIVDPKQEEDLPQEESFAMSAQVEYILRYFEMLGARIESPSKVRDYLYRCPGIAILAGFVSEQIYNGFDFKAQLSLEVQDDEVPDSEYLTIYVRVPEYNNSVMDRIRKIRESYYDSLNNMTGWFLLTTDFSSPR